MNDFASASLLPTFSREDFSDLVPTQTVGELLGLSTASVRDFVSKGVLPRCSPGGYDLLACARAYIAYLREQAARMQKRSAREGLLLVQKELLELELADKRGELLDRAYVRRELGEIARIVKERLLLLPARAAPQLTGLGRLEIEQQLAGTIHEVLVDFQAMSRRSFAGASTSASATAAAPAVRSERPESPRQEN